jgi:microcystin-dependent protein
MAKTKISEFDSIPANNTDIDGINIAEGCAPSGINNAIRELMAQLKDQQTGASDDNFTVGGNLTVDGTSTLTGNITLTGNVTFNGTTNILPAGVITLWSGAVAAVPSGWYLCNGSNGTPDLRDRFVVGAGSTYAVGATGGANTVTLDATMIPSHTHAITASGSTGTSGAHTHTFSGTSSGQSATHTHAVTDNGHSHSLPSLYGSPNSGQSGRADVNQSTVYTSTGTATTGITIGNASADHTHTYSGTTSAVSAEHTHTLSLSASAANTGGGLAHENRPPYYALAYIMKA